MPEGSCVCDCKAPAAPAANIGKKARLVICRIIALRSPASKARLAPLLIDCCFAAFLRPLPKFCLEKLVEAGGVEPPSEKRYATEPTCLSQFRLFRSPCLERARNSSR